MLKHLLKLALVGLTALPSCVTTSPSLPATATATATAEKAVLTASETDAIIERTRSKGGATFDLDERRFREKENAIAVSLKGSRNLPTSTTDVELAGALQAFMNQHEADLQDPRIHLGTWRAPDGSIALDVTILVSYGETNYAEALAEAQKIGRANGQQALYDLGKETEIPVQP